MKTTPTNYVAVKLCKMFLDLFLDGDQSESSKLVKQAADFDDSKPVISHVNHR